MLRLFQKSSPAPGPVEFLIVGLGNPGRQYEGTRHNAGFMALDAIAAKHHAEMKKVKFKGLVGECRLGGKKALLLKPSTYMNLSGQSVKEAMQFYKLPPEKVLVIFDAAHPPQGQRRGPQRHEEHHLPLRLGPVPPHQAGGGQKAPSRL